MPNPISFSSPPPFSSGAESAEEEKKRQPYALSASSVKIFKQCPLRFRYYAIDKIPSQPSIPKEKGTLVHAVLEKLFAIEPDRRKYQQAIDLLPTAWEEMLSQDSNLPKILFTGNKNAEHEFLTAAKALLENYFRLEKPENLNAYATEMYLRTDTENGLNLHGFADRVEKNPAGMVRIVDYKTGKSPRLQYQQDYRFQMMFYALMWWRLYQEIPASLQLLFLGDAHSLAFQPTLANIYHLQSELELTWKAIEHSLEKKYFSARRNPLCNWCDYQKFCPIFGGTCPDYPDSSAAHLLSITEKSSILEED